ncbi:uncharacterized protein EI97DRAFT_439827 [Westerdykella ornata]|uniref:Uncharacterized protein n=1 Tax=Westerdykella ornata TaxID=318751 RepID=A0A6A6JWP7_WESOR|nr:uncharacterized protein EI97DRAFT_439827 [Westerdykella ornata]KAF2279489.1 hypothetical protein EI97DRAFT_439827 [Westerdykella ornata]
MATNSENREEEPSTPARENASRPRSIRNLQEQPNAGTRDGASDEISIGSGRHQRIRPLSEIPEKEDIENLDAVFKDRQHEFDQRQATPSDTGSMQFQEQGEGHDVEIDGASIYTYETETFGDTSSIYTTESRSRRLRSDERVRPKRTTTTVDNRPFMDPTVSFSKKAEEQHALYHRNLQRDIAQKEYNSRRQSAQNSPTIERTLRHIHTHGSADDGGGENTGSPLRGVHRPSLSSKNSTPSRHGARSYHSIDSLRSASQDRSAYKSMPNTPNKEMRGSPLGSQHKRLSGSYSQDPFSPESPGLRELSSLQRALRDVLEEKKQLKAELDAEKERNRESERKLEDKVNKLEGSLQEAEQRAIEAEKDDQLKKALEVANKMAESAQQAVEELKAAHSDLSEAQALLKTEVDTLGAEKERLEEELRQRTSEKELLGQKVAEMEAKMSEEGGKYAKAMEQLLDDVSAMHGMVAENGMKSPAEFKDMFELGREGPDEAAELRIGIIELMVLYGTKASALAEEKAALEQELASRLDTITEMEQKHLEELRNLQEEVEKQQGLAQRLASQLFAEANAEDSKQKDDWEQLYHDKEAAYRKLSDEHERLRQFTIESNAPELKNQIKVLEERLVHLNKRYKLLATQRNQFREAAANWENEYRAEHEQYQQNLRERETMIEQHEQEMRETIKQYYDHLPKNDPEWFEIDALQKQVKKLEQLLAHKEGEVLRWQKERDTAVERFHEVRTAMEEGRYIRYAGLFADSAPRSGPRVPRYESEEETRERMRKLEELRRRQNERRVREGKEERRVEEIRRDRFREVGTKYPPLRPGWKELVKKSPEERWAVEA